MVLRFGIVGEGVTDQVVLENILVGYFGGEDEEPVINRVQPLFDVTGQKREPAPGGWDLVLKFLEAGEHRKALQVNDYLVIQIDTDVSEEKRYGVPHREDGRDLTVDELVARVIDKLKGLIGADFCREHGHRFLFAVAVHAIECWLLPLLYEDNRAGKVTGCLSAVNEARKRQNKSALSKMTRNGMSKDYRSYDDASREYTKRKRLMAVSSKNRSLERFIEQMGATKTAEEAAAADRAALLDLLEHPR